MGPREEARGCLTFTALIPAPLSSRPLQEPIDVPRRADPSLSTGTGEVGGVCSCPTAPTPSFSCRGRHGGGQGRGSVPALSLSC